MFVKITPLDTLFFRTGRPFNMGEDTWAECLFPPSPSSLYGAIRSLMIFKREGLKAFENGRYSADIGTPSKKGNFYLKGPILFKDELFFLPPYDLVKQKSNIKNELILLKFSKTPKLFTSDYSLENVLLHKSIEHIDEATGWLSKTTLIDYFRGKDELYKTVPDKELYCGEPK